MPTRSTKPLCRLVYSRSVPHGVKPEIVVTIYPNGTIGLRETRRPARTEQVVEVGWLYAKLVQGAVARADARRRELIQQGYTRKEARRKARKECHLE